ncbi:MAG: threonylcarbamoyl-AMP synthase [Chitinophagaceae bacterium]
MIVTIHPDNPQPRQIRTVVDALRNGEVIIYPTDTLYGFGCDIFQHNAIEKICRIRKVVPQKAQLSFICSDLGQLSDFARQVSKSTYRLLKQYLPGPYTFILPASSQVPKILQSKKDTIGLRIPANAIARAIIKELGNPIVSSSLQGEWVEDYTDPEVIHENFRNEINIVVDGGIGNTVPSTVIDCTGDEPLLIREGAGAWP